MSFDPEALFSPVAAGGFPPYFLRQPPDLLYDFDQGCPELDTFPLEHLKRLAVEVLDQDGAAALDYCCKGHYTELTLGYTALREEVARFIERRDGLGVDPDGVTIVNGSTQGIALTINAYVGAGDAVFVEAATFPFALKYLSMVNARIVPVPLDDDGMIVEELDGLIAAAKAGGANPKLIYTIPTHHLPTGSIMPLERRRKLLETADKWNLLVLEDNMYTPFGEKNTPPTLFGLDASGRVIHSDSFAKAVAPAVRVGWIASTPEVAMGQARVRQDLGVSTWLQRIMCRYLKEGLHEEHIEQLRPVYRAKRNAAAAALDKYCSRWITYTKPKGAWYFWLKIADDVDWQYVQEECFRRGIAMRPGERFLGHDTGASHMRLAVGHVPTRVIEEGMKLLGGVLNEASERPKSPATV